MSSQKRLLILIGSPRRDGNSAALAKAVQRGGEQAGLGVSSCFVDDYIQHFLRDCRSCRQADGSCSISDQFKALFFDFFLPADGVVFCSPIYWYGLSAQMKAFFDRTFCYYAASYPSSAEVVEQMSGKRVGLALASEESYPGASLGIIHQIQEYSRYTNSEFIGVVRGIGNSRNEVMRDPADPLHQAEDFGRNFFEHRYTDYQMDTPRAGRVWPAEGSRDDSA